jgi:uncharacterized protein YgbK (DUF1537 family)
MKLMLTYYGDDLTGSTDVLEALTLGGVPAVLFLEAPTTDLLQTHFPNVRAVGIAGTSRSLSLEDMDGELSVHFKALAALKAPILHYKVCSTFDSSPTTGSIGRAADIGRRILPALASPVIVGVPALKRYVIFGNLFAADRDVIYRLDRHPTMSQHPSTPMDEADLRKHLAKQTNQHIGLIDWRALRDSNEAIEARFRKAAVDGDDLIVLDTLDDSDLRKIGHLLWALAHDAPLFTIGSSGVEYALTRYWHEAGLIERAFTPDELEPVGQVLVMSGSASPQTAVQIDYAAQKGFVTIRLDAPNLLSDPGSSEVRQAAVTLALEALGNGGSVILYSTLGPDDPALEATRHRALNSSFDVRHLGRRLGTHQGLILHDILEHVPLKRIAIAGGDTCSYAARQLGIFALEMCAPLAVGVPLCLAHSSISAFSGLEIALKGGQVGQTDFFYKLLAQR